MLYTAKERKCCDKIELIPRNELMFGMIDSVLDQVMLGYSVLDQVMLGFSVLDQVLLGFLGVEAKEDQFRNKLII